MVLWVTSVRFRKFRWHRGSRDVFVEGRIFDVSDVTHKYLLHAKGVGRKRTNVDVEGHLLCLHYMGGQRKTPTLSVDMSSTLLVRPVCSNASHWQIKLEHTKRVPVQVRVESEAMQTKTSEVGGTIVCSWAPMLLTNGNCPGLETTRRKYQADLKSYMLSSVPA